MNKTMYEVNWHHANDKFSHCTVTPITVIREGVLPGCTGISITAKDSSGRKFQGSPDNYYSTEEAAWEAVKAELAEGIEAHEKQLSELQVKLATLREYLAKLTPNVDVTGLAPEEEDK